MPSSAAMDLRGTQPASIHRETALRAACASPVSGVSWAHVIRPLSTTASPATRGAVSRQHPPRRRGDFTFIRLEAADRRQAPAERRWSVRSVPYASDRWPREIVRLSSQLRPSFAKSFVPLPRTFEDSNDGKSRSQKLGEASGGVAFHQECDAGSWS